jgi:hypothetical protein
MKLKQTEYTTIEIAEDESYGMVIGNIVLDKNKMLYAEIVGGTICDHKGLSNMRAFLDEVGKAMAPEATSIFVDVTSRNVDMDIRCGR